VLQAADILLPRAHLVPSPRQRAHVEVAREMRAASTGSMARSFRARGAGRQRARGYDGQAKASKSLNNVIYLADAAATVEHKVRGMYTDPQRIRADIPARWKATRSSPILTPSIRTGPSGRPEGALPAREGRRCGGQAEVSPPLTTFLTHRERRSGYQAQPELVEDILEQGIRRMRREAEETLHWYTPQWEWPELEKEGIMHLVKVKIDSEAYPNRRHYPFNISVLRATPELAFKKPIAFFVGENGSGKSTLLYAITRKCGITYGTSPGAISPQ